MELKNTNAINKTRKKALNICANIFRWIFLISFSYILLYPIIFMVANAVKTQSDVMNPAVNWISHSPTLYSFKLAFEGMQYPKALRNTLIFSVASALIQVFTCAFYSYGISRFKMRINGLLTFFLILIILVPDIVLIMPRISNFRHLDFLGVLGLFGKAVGKELRPNVTDSIWCFYLPAIFGVGLKSGILMYIYIQFFKGLPVELEEAAWLDGAGPFKTFFKIILPSSGVVILTVTVFSVVWHWNDWLLPTMYTTNNFTLSSQLYAIETVIDIWARDSGTTINSTLSYGVSLCACILFIIPPIVMYLLIQRKFIKSIDRVGIVG